MKKLRLITAVSALSLAVGAFGAAASARELQPGDDHGQRHGQLAAREVQPGDDRGHDGVQVLASREPQPGDTRGNDDGLSHA